MNYYPPVQMCNNKNYIESNKTMLNYQMQHNLDDNKIVHQAPLQDQSFNICTSKRSVMDKQTQSFNSQLYNPFNSLIDIDSKLNNLNVIYNKCDYNPNLKDGIYVPCNKTRIKCVCGYKTPVCNNNTQQKSSYKNPWLNYAQIDSLSNDNVDRLRYYESCNTLPFMLNKISVKKPIVNNNKNNNCSPYFNKNTKNRKLIFP